MSGGVVSRREDSFQLASSGGSGWVLPVVASEADRSPASVTRTLAVMDQARRSSLTACKFLSRNGHADAVGCAGCRLSSGWRPRSGISARGAHAAPPRKALVPVGSHQRKPIPRIARARAAPAARPSNVVFPAPATLRMITAHDHTPERHPPCSSLRGRARAVTLTDCKARSRIDRRGGGAQHGRAPRPCLKGPVRSTTEMS
jgi:hypothetical protein